MSKVPSKSKTSLGKAAATRGSPRKSTPARALQWPEDGVQWRDKWQQYMPTVRGIHVPPVKDAAVLARKLTAPLQRDVDDIEWFEQISTAAGREWAIWQPQEWRARVTDHALKKADPEFWAQLYINAYVDYRADRVVYQGTKLHGPAFMLRVVLSLGHALQQMHSYASGDDLQLLRQLIAGAGQRQYQTARAIAKRRRGHSNALRVICSYLFPEVAVWAVDCVQRCNRAREEIGSLLDDCVMPVAVAKQHLKACTNEIRHWPSAIVLQLRVHGVAALGLLEQSLALSSTSANTQAVLAFITAVQAPETLHVLLRHLDAHGKYVVPVLDRLARKYPAAALCAAIPLAVAPRAQAVRQWAIRQARHNASALASALAAVRPQDRARFQALLCLQTPVAQMGRPAAARKRSILL